MTSTLYVPAGYRPDKKESLFGKTLNKIWLRQHVVCHTKYCEDAEKNVLCSSRDGVPLKRQSEDWRSEDFLLRIQ